MDDLPKLQPAPGLADYGGVDVELAHMMRDVMTWGASDLHLTVDRPPMVRLDGTLRPHPVVGVMDEATIERMLRTTMDDERWQVLQRRRQVDYAVSLPGQGRFRVNAYRQRGTTAAAFRAISEIIPTPAQIGLTPTIERLAYSPYGLVLFVGPTGSGKSTTQAALIGMINAERHCHILIIEDPIEFLHPPSVAMITHREVGVDVATFADGLRAALREDPDVVLVGEMRDAESIAIALTLAETGHLVFATLHSNDAAQAIDRIIDSYPGERRSQIQTQLASVLMGVVSQRLVPRVGGGRLAAFEVMIANDAVRNLVREGKTRQLRNVVATTSVEGMYTIESSLDFLVQTNQVTYADAVVVSQYPREIKDPGIVDPLTSDVARR